VSSSRSVDSAVAAVDVDGAVVVVVVVAGAGASALVVLVRNGRSNASFNRATFLGPKPGNRESVLIDTVVRGVAWRACVRRSVGKIFIVQWGGVRTPKVARRVSTSVLFTRGMLVRAVRRSASGVLSTRSRMSVGGRCSDCLYALRYWPASSALWVGYPTWH